jgi:hypothetical protein
MQGLRHMWRAHRAGYHGSIDPVSSAQDILKQWGARVHAAWFSAWRVLLIGAQIVLLVLLPSSYQKGAQRQASRTDRRLRRIAVRIHKYGGCASL